MDHKDEGREWMIAVVCEERETIFFLKKNQEILIFK